MGEDRPRIRTEKSGEVIEAFSGKVEPGFPLKMRSQK